MKLSDFKYELPDKMIAQYPTDKRGTSKLMVLNRATEEIIPQPEVVGKSQGF